MNRLKPQVIAILLPWLVSGCATRAVWDWAGDEVKPNRIGKAHDAFVHTDLIYLELRDVAGLRDGRYQISVPLNWHKLPTRTFGDGVLGTEPEISTLSLTWMGEPFWAGSSTPKPVVLSDSDIRGHFRRGNGRYGVQTRKGKGGVDWTEIYGWHPRQHQWVRVGGVEVGRGTRVSALRKSGAALATPVAVATDAIAAVSKVVFFVPIILYMMFTVDRGGYGLLSVDGPYEAGLVAIDFDARDYGGRVVSARIKCGDADGTLSASDTTSVVSNSRVPPGRYRLTHVGIERVEYDENNRPIGTTTDHRVVPAIPELPEFEVRVGEVTYFGKIRLGWNGWDTLEYDAQRELDVWKNMSSNFSSARFDRGHAVPTSEWAPIVKRRISALSN